MSLRSRRTRPRKLSPLPAPLPTRPARPDTGTASSDAVNGRAEIAVLGIRGIPANYGGLETCAEHTTAHWARHGLQVLVYCRSSHYEEHATALGGVQLKYTPSLRLTSLDTLSHTLFSILDLIRTERRVKLVHLYNTGNAIFLPLLKLAGKRVIVSGDGLEWKREKWGTAARLIHRLGERMAVRYADRVVVDNEEIRKYYAERYGKQAHLIAYGAERLERDDALSAGFLQRHQLEAKKYFIFVGRLVPEKGVHHLIDAYERLNTALPLVIIGDDTTRTAYRDSLLARRGERVRFLGFIYGEEYQQLLVNALMYVSASNLEGTSPSLLAAMGARVCCLVNGIEENRASTGLSVPLFRKNDYEDLRRLWQGLLDEPALMDAAADSGYEHVLQNYQWSTIAEKYLGLFKELSPLGRDPVLEKPG